MMYQLKPGQEAFEVVDGPFAGKKYEKGVSYDAVPEHEAHRFQPVALELPPAQAKLTDTAPIADVPAPAKEKHKRSDG